MRWTLATLVLLTGCSGEQIIHRPYDTGVRCAPFSFLPQVLDSDEAAAPLDQNGDGRLTESDLQVGEAAAVARVSGVYVDPSVVPQEERRAMSTHTDWNPLLRSTGDDVYEVEMRLNCDPTVITTISFRVQPAEAGERSTAEILELDFFAVDASVRNAPETRTIDGTLEVVRSETGMSGAFDGVVAAPLRAWEIPENLPYDVNEVTGQVGEIHPFAFRELPVAP